MASISDKNMTMDALNESLKKGVALVRNKERLRGKVLISAVVKERPDDIWGWLWLAAAVETNHERRQCVETVLELDPNNQEAKKILCKLDTAHFSPRTKRQQSHTPIQEPVPSQEPVLFQKRVLFQKEDKFDALLRKGITYIRNNERLEGKVLIREVVKERPDDVWGWLWLSAAVETNYERRQCLDTVLKLDPDNRQAKKILCRLEELSTLEALKMCRQSKAVHALAAPLPATRKNALETVKRQGLKKKLRLKWRLRRQLRALEGLAYTGMIVLPLILCTFLLGRVLFNILSMYSEAVSILSP